MRMLGRGGGIFSLSLPMSRRREVGRGPGAEEGFCDSDSAVGRGSAGPRSQPTQALRVRVGGAGRGRRATGRTRALRPIQEAEEMPHALLPESAPGRTPVRSGRVAWRAGGPAGRRAGCGLRRYRGIGGALPPRQRRRRSAAAAAGSGRMTRIDADRKPRHQPEGDSISESGVALRPGADCMPRAAGRRVSASELTGTGRHCKTQTRRDRAASAATWITGS
jgi:hypothetical protein